MIIYKERKNPSIKYALEDVSRYGAECSLSSLCRLYKIVTIRNDYDLTIINIIKHLIILLDDNISKLEELKKVNYSPARRSNIEYATMMKYPEKKDEILKIISYIYKKGDLYGHNNRNI